MAIHHDEPPAPACTLNPPDLSSPKRARYTAPVVALLLLSPVISEVLFGATRITTLFVLLPQVGTWGYATLLIREAVRRHRRGWPSIVLLGLALAVAEECVIQQTSLRPLVGADLAHPYARALGVNWIYLLWALGYESLWVVALPIMLTELIFPSRRAEPWLGARGLVISSVVFVLASFVAWYSWTQVFLPKFFPELAYQVPWPPVVIALAAIIALAVIAFRLPCPRNSGHGMVRPAPGPWVVGLVALVWSLLWCSLIFLAYGALPTLPPVFPMVAGFALAGLAGFLIARWSRRLGWQDFSHLALVSGGMTACMLMGFPVLIVGAALPVDIIGKLVLNLIAVALLIRLAHSIRNRSRSV